jgi:excinuclease ABC subunit A
LSGGEAQRIRLASQIGAGLVGVTYILDEPSIGLHQRDNKKLLSTLKRLKELGNTVIVVEHDQETIEEADHIIDIGPKAGIHGGEVCFSGNVESLKKAKNSLTSQYVFGKKRIQIEKKKKITR